MPTESAKLWILVTDGHRARIMIADAAEGRFRTLLPLGVCEYPYCPPPLRNEIAHRQFGQFASDVADRLDKYAAAGAFDTLLLIAPAMVTREIRELLSPATLGRIVSTLNEDYAALDDDALSARITRWWLPPAGAIERAGDCGPVPMTL